MGLAEPAGRLRITAKTYRWTGMNQLELNILPIPSISVLGLVFSVFGTKQVI